MPASITAHNRGTRYFRILGNPYVLLVLIGIVLYIKTLAFRFTYFDDDVLIVSQTSLAGSWGNLKHVFTAVHPGFGLFYRPMLMLSFMFDMAVGGLNPLVYHASNVCYHIIASILVYVFLCRIAVPRNKSLWLTLFFTLHPVLTEAVAWIPGRNDSLLAIFVLLSASCFVSFAQSGRAVKLYAHLLFLLAALLTKETALSALPLMAVYLVLFGGSGRWLRFLPVLPGWAAVVYLWTFMRSSAAGLDSVSSVEIWDGLVRGAPALVQYFGKVFFPVQLSPLSTVNDASFAWGVLAVAGMIAALWYAPVRPWRKFGFGLLWFLFFLAPTLLLPINIYLEHRLYLPFVGILIMAEGLWSSFPKSGRLLRAAYPCAVAILAGLFLLTFNYADVFMNRLVFWEAGVKASPQLGRAHSNLGAAYNALGYYEKAEQQYLYALRLDPNPEKEGNLGVVYINLRQFDKAERLFLQRLKVSSDDDYLIWFNYGGLLYQRGRMSDAERCWRRAIRLRPDFVPAYRNLALLLDEEHRTDAAGALWRCLRNELSYSRARVSLRSVVFKLE